MENKKLKLLEISFDNLYPLSSESVSIILDYLGETNRNLISLTKDLWSFGRTVIFNREKSVKIPTIVNIMNVAIGRNTKVIILSDCSSGCYNAVSSFNKKNNTDFSIMKIIRFMSEEYKDTIPISMGCNANKSIGDNTKPKKSITIRVPLEGFPEIGYGGNLNSSDIYKILETRTNPHIFETKGFDIVMTAFEKVANVLGEGKNITSNRWNAIMTNTGVFAYLESEE